MTSSVTDFLLFLNSFGGRSTLRLLVDVRVPACAGIDKAATEIIDVWIASGVEFNEVFGLLMIPSRIECWWLRSLSFSANTCLVLLFGTP